MNGVAAAIIRYDLSAYSRSVTVSLSLMAIKTKYCNSYKISSSSTLLVLPVPMSSSLSSKMFVMFVGTVGKGVLKLILFLGIFHCAIAIVDVRM